MSDNLTLDQKLADLETRLDETVAAAKKRRKTMTIVFVILAVFMSGYLYFAYSQIKTVDAPLVVSIAEQSALPYLNKPANEWAAELKAQAPDLIELASAELQKVPSQMSDRVAEHLDAKIEEEMPAIEEEFTKLVLALVDEAAKAKDENLKDGEFSDGDAKELARLVADQFEASLSNEIGKLYVRYGGISDELIGRMEYLADDKGLTEAESLQREIFVNFLALMTKVQKNPPQ